ncbi:hypothetical protein [Gloeobacter kilaueensis]|uniref:Uncharacterized protein n=1 Tax=Gloeobacter kilaueensis (strain ATCC BAA-2537 / CCAP 1431/1 / ULC 316 / JS1) TaxID=1183438 RepID=U5QKJ0_GLOK1|nr:hypothetical protein [Gloeobacter kilaueensis]AGY58139.1 hypothetical protein GKIL_1893 [Gloeobacter kilaueensis JS1]
MASLIGKVKTIKDLFLEKLDLLLTRTAGIELVVNATLESTTAALEAAAFQAEHLSRLGLSQKMFLEQIAAQQLYQAEQQQLKDKQLIAVFEKLIARQEQHLPAVGQPVIRRSASVRPELALIAHLYSFLPCRVALAVEDTAGEATAGLLAAGFAVWVLGVHRAALPDLPDLHPLQLSLAEENTAAGWTLMDLHTSGKLPEAIGLMYFGAGTDVLWALSGQNEQRYPVVALPLPPVAEHWPTLVSGLRERGYHWHIGLYRVGNGGEMSFFCNARQPIEAAQGTVFFFTEQTLFAEARDWGRAVLPVTYFC